LAIATKEMQAAFNAAKENVQYSLRKEIVACSGCGEKNANDSIFCRKCGQNARPVTGKNE